MNEIATLGYWNRLAGAHFPELVMVLTAALVALADRYARRILAKISASWGRTARFALFLLVCSVGYAAMALALAWGLRAGLTAHGGDYMAPAAVGILLLVAVEAQRQRQV